MAGRGGGQLKRLGLLAVRLVVGGIFVYAGWNKARDPGAFIRDIWNYHVLPEGAAYWIAAFVPYLEMAAGLALITGRHRAGAHVVLGGLLVTFLALLGSALLRGLDISCGCFGQSSTSTPAARMLWIDLLLFAGVCISALGARAESKRVSSATSESPPSG